MRGAEAGQARLDERRALLGAIGAALALGLFWMWYASPVPVSDYEKFRELAEDMLRHGQFGWPEPTAYRFPGYPALLALAMRASLDIGWLRLVNVLLSAALVPVAFVLGKRLANGDGRYGLAAAWTCALNPSFLFFAPILASEHLYTLLVFGGLAVLAPAPLALLVSGTCLGLACLTRGEGLFQVPTFLLALVLATPRQTFLRSARHAALLLLPVGLVLGLWMARNTALVGPGSGLSTSGGVNFYMGHGQKEYGYQPDTGAPFEGLSEPAAQAKAYRISFAALRANPARLARDVAIGTWEHFRPGAYGVSWSARLPRPSGGAVYPDKVIPGRRFFSWIQVLGYAVLCALAALALLLHRRIPKAAWTVPLSLALWNWVCYAVVFNANARYRYLGEAAFCLLAAAAMASVWSVWRPRKLA